LLVNEATGNEIGYLVWRSAKLLDNSAIGNVDVGISVAPIDSRVRVLRNQSHLNGVDMEDQRTDCTDHVWKRNEFETANQGCIQ
jgi:hypothetical protein